MERKWQSVSAYFTFSKKERTGIFILLGVMAFILLFFRFLPANNEVVDDESFQNDLSQLKIAIDTSVQKPVSQQTRSYSFHSIKYNNNPAAEGALFTFDPNTLDQAGWKRLGVKDKTIVTIQHFLDKGFRFRQPDDILKIYGLNKALAEKLIPYVSIKEKEKPTSGNSRINTADYTSKALSSKSTIVNINTCDTSALIALPGIGSKLAGRIVHFREKLGGFYCVSQVAETYGLADSTFEKIKPRLECNNPVLKTIHLNTADVAELRAHPYLKWNIANAIVNYRLQHGIFSSVNDLKKIDLISDETFQKISPYLITE